MKIFVHVHVYYAEQWPLLENRLRSISAPFDLCVTFVAGHPETEEAVLRFKPDADILRVSNRGYDVGPFLTALARVDLTRYDYLIKLHTKRDLKFFGERETPNFEAFPNRRNCLGSRWRDALLSFLATPETFAACLAAFEANPKLGMTGNWRLIAHCGDDCGVIYEAAAKLLQEHGLPPGADYPFLAGTMFLARAKLFEPLLKMNLSDADFEPTRRVETGVLAHVMERVFGGMIAAQGYELRDVYSRDDDFFHRIPFAWACARVFRVFYQSRITSSGHRIVKVLKIPVWRAGVVPGTPKN